VVVGGEGGVVGGMRGGPSLFAVMTSVTTPTKAVMSAAIPVKKPGSVVQKDRRGSDKTTSRDLPLWRLALVRSAQRWHRGLWTLTAKRIRTVGSAALNRDRNAQAENVRSKHHVACLARDYTSGIGAQRRNRVYEAALRRI
jgi:hypothetical protein